MNFRIYRLPKRNRWRLEYFRDGKRFRPSFKTKEKAEAEAAALVAEAKSSDAVWTSMSPAERADLMLVLAAMRKAGTTPRKVWEDHQRSGAGHVVEITLDAGYQQFMREKTSQRLSDSALAAYRSNVGRFIRGREQFAASTIKREDVLAWLAPYKDETFNSYLTSLNTFFLWLLHLGHIAKSPTAKIKKIERRRMANADVPPRIFKFDELKALLKTTVQLDPGLVRYVAVCNFAGLRPEREARELLPGDIGEAIHVRRGTAKDGDERFVEIMPVLAAWLAVPYLAPLDARLCVPPLQGPHVGDHPIRNLRRRFEKIRLAAGLVTKNDAGELVGWEQDIMRHTFASVHLVIYGEEKTKAALGHGDFKMLFSHYRKALSRAEAEKFLTLTPAICMAAGGGCLATNQTLVATKSKDPSSE